MEEDILLAKAYVSATDNKLLGKDQKGTAFWCEVKKKFDILANQQEAGSDQGAASIVNWVDRDQASLMNRFQRTIGKQVQYWNKYYKQVKDSKPSGWNEGDYIKEACINYAEEIGRAHV